MGVIELADGEPYVGNLVAVVDESARTAGAGVYYLVCSAIIIEPHAIRRALEQMVGNRPRPFHYTQEGARIVDAMVDLIVGFDVSASCRWRSVGRRRQLNTRPDLLKGHLPELVSIGATHLIIEAGEMSVNQSDSGVLLDFFRNREEPAFAYDWRSKREPLLWIADAICGIVGDHLTDKRHRSFERLNDCGAIEVWSH